VTRTVTVEAPARLHFGLLDLRGDLGRRFGGIGAPAPEITARVSVSAAERVDATGPDAARAADFARRFLSYHKLTGGARVAVARAIPTHSGLGSGTQLGLCIARALAELHGLETTAPELARSIGRARRSAVGTWTFEGGGFVLEGGRRGNDSDDEVAPLLVRLPFPESWRCVVAVPVAKPGISGDAEARAFATLPPPSVADVERVSHLVVMAMLPALVEGDLARFGASLSEVQEINGRWFSEAQGGLFAPGPSTRLINRMRELDVPGVGQSSWGPAVYGIVDGDAAAVALADALRTEPGSGLVVCGAFPSTGARAT
jgi:beta-ribofuranosylaminobenzene 5'-phosphate synthase